MIKKYNQYLSEYTSILSARSTAHQPKELRAVYNRIRAMSQHSPFYLLNLSQEKQEFALSLKNTALALGASLDELRETACSPVTLKAAVSSEPEALSAELLPGSAENFTEPLQIQIDQLACAQQNCGRYLPSESEGPASAAYRFTIHSCGEDYEFTYQVSTSPTNRALMEKLTNFINQSNIGINAVLESDEAAASRIVLTATETGVPEDETLAFTITDNAGSASPDFPGLISYFGLSDASTKPANARFTLNGEPKSSMHNRIVLSRALSLTLKQTTDAPVDITFADRSAPPAHETASFIGSYNRLITLSRQGLPGNRLSARLFHVLDHIIISQGEQLGDAGIKRQTDGTLTLSGEAPAQIFLKPDLFSEPEGIFSQLTSKTRDIAINPMEYLDKTLITYPNLSRTGVSNPYITSLYSGMLFNSYC